ncbi:hypothetical protein KVF89_11275 [Nocardioides carbamazepini]|jgi:hypothetical protein|uniref:hypothetical protein n=1 Tax=Nocardioides carbamazepini TaxID=2854259 RepID=UPI002149C3AA|nr:hypothetical protein [Nocardioides carbamazepini]MCR1783114.1 hypothetical protein [Nocardioides carbamazepini]
MTTSSTIENLPTFGLLRIEVFEPGVLTGCLGQNDIDTLDDLTAEELRKLAADALAAAEWLEANQ